MAARQWRGLAAVLAGLVLVSGTARAQEDAGTARMRHDITFLASPECEGRGVTTAGINKAADFIAGVFQKAGLKPARPDGSYFQPFTMPGATLDAPPRLVLRGPAGQEIELRPGEHFEALGLSSSGDVSGPLVFAGYGISVAGANAYDDYADLDVTGKIVVILRDTPRADNKFAAFANRQRAAALTAKLSNAFKHGAAAVLFVNDHDTARDDDLLMNFGYNATSQSPVKLPSLHVRRSVLDPLLRAATGQGLLDLEQDIDRELKPRSAPLTGWTARLDVRVTRGRIGVKNVVGVLEGAGPSANETIVLGAHYDHLGYGGGFGSLFASKRPTIHPGADDNGSGTTTLLELARRFGAKPRRDGRRLVFIAFSGEESGLLGSVHYCKDPLFPLSSTVAMLNMDMVGRLRPDAETKKDRLIVYGTGTSQPFEGILDTANQKCDFKLNKFKGAMMVQGGSSSDHESFYARKVPVLFFFTDLHGDYHRPSDTADKINVAGMKRIADLVEDITDRLRVLPERPEYVRVTAPPGPRPVRGGMPRIGIRPSYGDDKEGVLLEGVSDDTPASRAGLKEGDRIVTFAGKPVQNVEAYMSLLMTCKKGEPVELGIQRGGKKITVKVTPE
jgi:hypothetical protein